MKLPLNETANSRHNQLIFFRVADHEFTFLVNKHILFVFPGEASRASPISFIKIDDARPARLPSCA